MSRYSYSKKTMKKKIKKSLRSKRNKKGGSLPGLFLACGMGIFGTKIFSKAYENYNKTSPSRLTVPETNYDVDLDVSDNEFKNILVNAFIKKNSEKIIDSPKKGFIPKIFKPNLNMKTRYYQWFKHTDELINKYKKKYKEREKISDAAYSAKKEKLKKEQTELTNKLEQKSKELNKLEEIKEKNTEFFNYIDGILNNDDREGIIGKVSEFLKEFHQKKIQVSATAAAPAGAAPAGAADAPAAAPTGKATAAVPTATAMEERAATSEQEAATRLKEEVLKSKQEADKIREEALKEKAEALKAKEEANESLERNEIVKQQLKISRLEEKIAQAEIRKLNDNSPKKKEEAEKEIRHLQETLETETKKLRSLLNTLINKKKQQKYEHGFDIGDIQDNY